MRLKVLKEGYSLKRVRDENPIGFINDADTLRKMRLYYLQDLPPSQQRLTFYIDGPGGIGKGTASRAIARALFPGLEDDEVYFSVGKDAGFNGYDGQPVVIWNDRRAIDLLKELGGRGNVFEVFDTYPSNAFQNVKFGVQSLAPVRYHIINGIQPYEEFLDGLAGEYKDRYGQEIKAEDKSQAYRRVPLILNLDETVFDILVNKGFFMDTREFSQYIHYRSVVGNFGRIHQVLEGKALEVKQLEMTQPVVEAHDELKKKMKQKISSVDDIPDELKNYGKSVIEKGK